MKCKQSTLRKKGNQPSKNTNTGLIEGSITIMKPRHSGIAVHYPSGRTIHVMSHMLYICQAFCAFVGLFLIFIAASTDTKVFNLIPFVRFNIIFLLHWRSTLLQVHIFKIANIEFRTNSWLNSSQNSKKNCNMMCRKVSDAYFCSFLAEIHENMLTNLPRKLWKTLENSQW